MPVVYLTNAASRVEPYRGPGRAWTIMAAPRHHYGEGGDGYVEVLRPPLEWVRDALAGDLPMPEYRDRYLALLANTPLRHYGPQYLCAKEWDTATEARHHLAIPVADGDTLLCVCSRARAAAGCCHRVWAAEVLLDAGWTVVLDGLWLDRWRASGEGRPQ